MNDVLLIISNRWDVMDKGINASNKNTKMLSIKIKHVHVDILIEGNWSTS